MPDSKILGQNYPRVDAADKVSGQSQYASDVYLPGMLMCKVLQSPKPHARILHIDTSRAQGLPGVRAVLTGRDVPDARFGNGAVKDKRLFALDKVRYIGEPVAAVAAVDEITALEALDLIDVTYEDLPAVTDPIAALRPDFAARARFPKMARPRCKRDWRANTKPRQSRSLRAARAQGCAPGRALRCR